MFTGYLTISSLHSQLIQMQTQRVTSEQGWKPNGIPVLRRVVLQAGRLKTLVDNGAQVSMRVSTRAVDVGEFWLFKIHVLIMAEEEPWSNTSVSTYVCFIRPHNKKRSVTISPGLKTLLKLTNHDQWLSANMNSHCEFCWIANLYSTATNQHWWLLIIVDWQYCLPHRQKRGPKNADLPNGDWEPLSSWSCFTATSHTYINKSQVPPSSVLWESRLEIQMLGSLVTFWQPWATMNQSQSIPVASYIPTWTYQ